MPLIVCINEDRLHLHLVPKLTLTDRRYTLTTITCHSVPLRYFQ